VRQAIADWRAGQTLGELKIQPELIEQIKAANRLRMGLETPASRRAIPVSVKTRIGYEHVVVEQWIRALLEERPAAITIHGRTLKQQYKGSADWAAIAQAVALAKGSSTLILGNGDLRDMNDIYRRVHETGVDGVLVGRAAQGNPWLFQSKEAVKHALRSDAMLSITKLPVSVEQRFAVMIQHARHFEAHWGAQCFVGMRKHLAWYCHATPKAAELRARMVRVNNLEELLQCLSDYKLFLEMHRESAFPYCERTSEGGHAGPPLP
jgi:tRNA-dihydrouridine synthase